MSTYRRLLGLIVVVLQVSGCIDGGDGCDPGLELTFAGYEGVAFSVTADFERGGPDGESRITCGLSSEGEPTGDCDWDTDGELPVLHLLNGPHEQDVTITTGEESRVYQLVGAYGGIDFCFDLDTWENPNPPEAGE